MPQPPPAAVIFDMDGLLLDSEVVKRGCFQRVAINQGWVLPNGVYESLVGRRGDRESIQHHVPSAIGIDTYSAAVDAAYDREIEAGIPPKPGAMELVRHLKACSLPRAVATSTDAEPAGRKLAGAGLFDLIDAMACGDQVANVKPAPDIFLLAAERLGVTPSQCLAFEDSPAGVRAALAAGMRVVQVPDLVGPEPGIEARGVIVAETLLAGAAQVGLCNP